MACLHTTHPHTTPSSPYSPQQVQNNSLSRVITLVKVCQRQLSLVDGGLNCDHTEDINTFWTL